MLSFIKNRFKPNIEPMNIIHINKNAILNNYHYLQKLRQSASIFPVLKSNAYWHGIDQILNILKWIEIPYIVVDSFPEYNIVYRHSKFKILLLWETLPVNYKHFNLKRTTFAVYNLETLQVLAKLHKKVKIHLFLNTGMNREWIDINLLPNALEFLKWNHQITIEWVMSHLHSADSNDTLSIETQINAFKTMYHQILEYWHTPVYRHIWASAGLLKIDDEFFNAFRPGLSLYWYNPLLAEDSKYELWNELQPALSLTSTIVAINSISYNEGVSYWPQWKQYEKKSVTSITIPFWYAEWLFRSCREKIQANYKWSYLKQIWTICMNLSCFLWNDKVLIWDKVNLIEAEKDSPCSIYSIAKSTSTIPYEILVHLDKWIRREIIE